MKNQNFYHLLENTYPFDLLPKNELFWLAENLESRVYKEGELIYQREKSEIKFISIVYKGKIEKYFLSKNGEKEFIEYFSSGEVFGEMSMMLNNTSAIRNTLALEETTVFQMSFEKFWELSNEYASFANFFTSRFAKRMFNSQYALYLKTKNPTPSNIFENSDYFFQRKLTGIDLQPFHLCSDQTSICEAAKLMFAQKTSFLLVENSDKEVIGIITDYDMRKVVAEQIDYQDSVQKMMSKNPISISEDARIYQAILLMVKKNINYLLVKNQEKYLGLVSQENLLFYQTKSPFQLIQNIYQIKSKTELAQQWQQIPEIIDELLDRGIRSETVNEIISIISDAITNNLIRQSIKELGKAPARFAFVALGSEGRKEQTLKTDQDNAIIYEDVPEELKANAQAYFSSLANLVCDWLNHVGFQHCNGGYMAKNPLWCSPLSVWKQNYATWIEKADNQALLNSIIFFDARAIYGDAELLDSLKDFTAEILQNRSALFFLSLGKSILISKAPLTFFNGFQLSENEQQQKGLDIKKAMRIVVDFARIYALKHQVRKTNTGERLEELLEKGIIDEQEFRELAQAYYYLMNLRLKHQVLQLKNQHEPDNFLILDEISKIEQVTLKEVFKITEKFQTKISIDFTGTLR
ncbi:MAG: CBS domain-containing protein [Bacteroidetes bacterium]|nr:MAG: CBS domain-containing protein [Bacteroidota bacterium]